MEKQLSLRAAVGQMAKRKSRSFMKLENSLPRRSLQSDPSLGHLTQTHTHKRAPGPVWVPQNITLLLPSIFCFGNRLVLLSFP